MTIRRAEMSSGIEPGGITRVEQRTPAPPATIDGDGGDDDGLDDEAGEQRATARPDRLEHPVEAEALDGEQGEEQRHHDDRDGDRSRR